MSFTCFHASVLILSTLSEALKRVDLFNPCYTTDFKSRKEQLLRHFQILTLKKIVKIVWILRP